MSRQVRRRFVFACALLVALAGQARAATPVRAAIVPWGTVLVAGTTWAGADAALGDLNVYSNGTGSQDQSNAYGLAYECVELAVRWAEVKYGDPHSAWRINYASQMWQSGPHLPVPFLQHPNGGADGPQHGDILVFDSTPGDPTGHVAVVSGTGPGYVDIVEQNYANYNPTGLARLPIQGTSMPVRWGLPILGWLRSVTAPAGGQGLSGPGGYLSDQTGQVYTYGSAMPPSEQTVWPSAATAVAIARLPKSSSGYVLDSYGGLHGFGGAPRVKTAGAYWFGQPLARGLVLTSTGKGGYALDSFGGLHNFGDAAPMVDSAYWPGQDVARGLVLRDDGAGGWVLDEWGGLHPFGAVPNVRLNNAFSVSDGDIARGLCLRGDGVSGWWVDGANDLHSFGGAPQAQSTGDFPGQDVARGIACAGDNGGYTITAWGNVRAFGDAPTVFSFASFANPVAAGLSG